MYVMSWLFVALLAPMPDRISACDQSIWRRVWRPERLEVVRECITVRGFVRATENDGDGDFSLEVQVDQLYLKEYPDLLNDSNRREYGGRLVAELVCRRPVSQSGVGDTCDGYESSDTNEPEVGDYVAVHGPLVRDVHGWMEIHPAEVQILRRSAR